MLTNVEELEPSHEDHCVQSDHEQETDNLCDDGTQQSRQQSIYGVIDEQKISHPMQQTPEGEIIS